MGTASLSQPSSDDQRRARKVRRFTIAVSLAMIILCNAIVLVGLWASGINLDELVTTPDVFNSKQDICLRLGWQPLRERRNRCVSARNGSIYPIRPARLISCNRRSSFGTGRTGAVLCGPRGLRRLSVADIGVGYRGSHCVRAGGEMVSGRPGIGCVSNPPPATGHHLSIELELKSTRRRGQRGEEIRVLLSVTAWPKALQHERTPRREGRRACRNDESRHFRSTRLHDFDRGVRRILQEAGNSILPACGTPR